MNKWIKNTLCFGLSALLVAGTVIPLDTESVTAENGSAVGYTETNDYLVKDGVCDYTIVVEAGYADYLDMAVEELKLFFLEATGIELSVKTTSNVSWSVDAKYICLGQNAVFEAAGLSTEGMQLGYEGYTIQTVGKSIFIAGDRDRGTLFGVYEFLEIEFDLDFFSNTYYYIETGVKNESLKNYNYVDIPDIALRNNSSWLITTDSYANLRMRFGAGGSTYCAGYETVHSGFQYLPKTTYCDPSLPATYHPAWYADSGSQLCYTAHGNPDEYDAMQTEVFVQMRDYLMGNPDAVYLRIGIEDKFGDCTCSTCTYYASKYGTKSAVLVKFCNDLAAKIDAWMATDEGKPYERDFWVQMLAYYNVVSPPAKFNASKNAWEPVDTSAYATCNEHVSVMFAPIFENYHHSIYAPENTETYNQYLGWLACHPNSPLSFFMYDTNYADAFAWCDTFNYLYDYIELIGNDKPLFATMCGQRQASAAPAWYMLKIYLKSKLFWDTDADVGEYTKKFFKYYYGPASEFMYSFFTNYRAHSKYLIDNEISKVTYYISMTEENYFSKSFLEQCLGYVNGALQAISYLQYIDSGLYQTYYDHITLERLSIYYMLIEIWADSYDSDFIYQMKLTVREDANRVGMSRMSESGGTVDDLFTQWGL